MNTTRKVVIVLIRVRCRVRMSLLKCLIRCGVLTLGVILLMTGVMRRLFAGHGDGTSDVKRAALGS